MSASSVFTTVGRLHDIVEEAGQQFDPELSAPVIAMGKLKQVRFVRYANSADGRNFLLKSFSVEDGDSPKAFRYAAASRPSSRNP
jgi:hypothetical protein